MNKVIEIVKYLKKQINALSDIRRVSEQKNVEQSVFYNLGAIDSFREILNTINQYEKDEIDALDKIIIEIKSLEWSINKVKKYEYLAMDWEYKQAVKHKCDKVSFLCEKLFKQIEEQENKI